MKVTMQSIADLAGVSRATVDKVIHNRPGVSDAVKNQILAIIAETNYTPVHMRNQPEAKPEEPLSKKHLAVLVPDSQSSFILNLKAGMNFAYTELHPENYVLDFYYFSNYESQQIIDILHHLKRTQLFGIALYGIQRKEICNLIDEFAQLNIPVITYAADLPASQRFAFIGEDYFRTGQIAASLLCKLVDHQGSVAILTNSANADSSQKRIKGFSYYLEKHAPNVDIIAIEETLNQPSLVYQTTARLLKYHSSLKGLWNCSDHSESMAQAVIDFEKNRSIKLVSLSFTPEVISMVKNGMIDYTIGLTPYKLGELVIKHLFNCVLSESPIPSAEIETPVYIGCDANIDTFEIKTLSDQI